MAVKFPLKMQDGTMVKTLEDLQAHFDLTTVLSYYDNGRLVKWLENGYYDDEAAKVSALDATSAGFAKELCAILGVDYSESGRPVDLGDVSKRNERLQQLKQITADDAILSAVDRVAFTQEELTTLLSNGVEEVYLLGEHFVIPGKVENIKYIGLNNPLLHYDGEAMAAGTDFQGVQFDVDTYICGDFFNFFGANISLGMRYLCVAANNGSAEAQAFLGECYENGRGVDTNETEAVRWYRKAAEQGHARAQDNLGECYYYGRGVDKDYVEAVKWFRLAAEQGLAAAQKNLGARYYCGQGVENDYGEAVRWFRLAAEQGYEWAQYSLGVCYYFGLGVEKDYGEAVRWYRLAAEQGLADAQVKLGDCYFEGKGVGSDWGAAEKWYLRAAEQGLAEAQNSLGVYYYRTSLFGLGYKKAVKWYRLAAEQGYAAAQYNLGDSYYRGHGVEKDVKEAAKWYRLAAEQGNENAKKKLDELSAAG